MFTELDQFAGRSRAEKLFAGLIKSSLDKQKDKLGKRGLFTLVVVICLALIGLVLLIGCSQGAKNVELRPKAAIVDQLYVLEPPQDFID